MSTDRPAALLARFVRRVEDTLLVLTLATMVIAAVAQIVLRDVFDVTLLWTAPLVRLLVLWGGLIGAVVAVREDRNIRIEAVIRLCPRHCRRWLGLLSGLSSVAVCVSLAWIGLRFVSDEFTYGDTTSLGISAWQAQLILPVAFAAMAAHFCVRLLKSRPL